MLCFRQTLIAALALSVMGCGLPWDPEQTLERVRGKTLRVGVSHNPPWTDLLAETEPSGVEANMVREIAENLGARIDWRPGGEMELMRELEGFELDLVIGGLTEDTPWKDRVGLTQPHTQTSKAAYVFATPPGENAWILFLDRQMQPMKTASGTLEPSP